MRPHLCPVVVDLSARLFVEPRLLWEKKDLPGGLAPSFITHSAGFLLNVGWPVIIEGILSATFYGSALRGLIAAHRGRTLVYFLQVELAETFARHASRPEAAEFSTADVTSWFEPDDWLDVPGEIVIPQTSTLPTTVNRIYQDAQIDRLTTSSSAPIDDVRPAAGGQ
ncbi:hypothetical protein [Amycolatopsis sp. GM8]|uniref:hypothetical protein n=1 Tax=Amycolatopsis sp. GM8 TaxID=2896530 RepID=UPI001F4442A5|nr:hypothetical protein [Amycolatopsis sp. GM8]